MSASVNKSILVGHLGRDPEIRHSQSGDKIATLSLATSESWKDRATGEKREKTEWHRVVIFNPGLADIAEKYARKGSRVYIEGQMQTRKWTDQAGVERYTTEVVLGRFRGELVLLSGATGAGGPPPAEEPAASAARATPHAESGWAPPAGLDDEIPF